METCYGCYSDYGWTVVNQGFDNFCDAEKAKEHWGDEYRIVSNITGEVLIGHDQRGGDNMEQENEGECCNYPSCDCPYFVGDKCLKGLKRASE